MTDSVTASVNCRIIGEYMGNPVSVVSHPSSVGVRIGQRETRFPNYDSAMMYLQSIVGKHIGQKEIK